MQKTPAKKLNFTKRALEALPVPPEGRQIVFDTQTLGLGFTVFASGVRTFFHRRFANGRAERTTLGSFDDLSIPVARGRAADINARAAQWKLDGFKGPSPFAKTVRTGATFGELIEAYIKGKVSEANNPADAERNVRWMVKKYFPAWTARRIDSIGIDDVLTVRNKVGEQHKYQANRLVEMVKAVFSWSAKSRDGKVNFWPVENPARNVELYDEEKRERFLQPHELVAFNDELKKEAHRDLRDFLTLALATGARKSNVLAMRWTDIVFERANWNIPGIVSKNGKAYDVSLMPAALQVLRRRREETPDDAEFVFPSHGKSGHLTNLKKQWDRFRKRAGFPDVRIHDIRRTKGSYMAISGVSLQHIGAVLGHRSLESTEIYARLHQESLRKATASGSAAMQRMTQQARKRMKRAARKPKLLPLKASAHD
jgi:integrase